LPYLAVHSVQATQVRSAENSAITSLSNFQ
jgi:hypothetical protein